MRMKKIIDSFLSELLCHLQRSKKSFYALISLLSLCLLAYNSASIFCTQVPISPKTPPEPAIFLPENVAGKSRKFFSIPSSEKPPPFKAHLPLLHKNHNFLLSAKAIDPKRRRRHKFAKVKPFEVRVKQFFNKNSSHSRCESRFFMTWISSAESFGEREMFAITSLFKTHPNGCLVIASESLDSRIGRQILKPLLNKGFRLTSISPDFDYIFKGTPAMEGPQRLGAATA